MMTREFKMFKRNRGNWLAAVLLCAMSAQPAAAAGIAEYHVAFDATWNAQDHPYDFPSNAHFSGLVGGTHDSSVKFWGNGDLASVGIQRMAELGRQTELASEVNAAITAGSAYSTILGSGTRAPGVANADFRANPSYPLATLVSMVAPSPDWFVGVHDLDLTSGGQWQDKIVVDLFPYDAGTDSGVTFTSPDLASVPHVPISRITTFPFPNTPRLGTFTFTLTKEYSAGDANGDGHVDANDYFLIDRGFLVGLNGYSNGDFDLNGKIDADDYFLIDRAFSGNNSIGAAVFSAAAAPEPGMMGLAALGGLLLARRRR